MATLKHTASLGPDCIVELWDDETARVLLDGACLEGYWDRTVASDEDGGPSIIQIDVDGLCDRVAAELESELVRIGVADTRYLKGFE